LVVSSEQHSVVKKDEKKVDKKALKTVASMVSYLVEHLVLQSVGLKAEKLVVETVNRLVERKAEK
jgi:hypothetical protein